jgi:hypothetical protein
MIKKVCSAKPIKKKKPFGIKAKPIKNGLEKDTLKKTVALIDSSLTPVTPKGYVDNKNINNQQNNQQ